MNVIFLDFDGVIDTAHFNSLEDIEERIKILGDICQEYDCKVVIESASKPCINEETLEVDEKSWINYIFELFKKYDIDCIGRTPNVGKRISDNTYLSMWKEDEILLYLKMHPEIEHYCIIDDDDSSIVWGFSDLDKVREHLVQTNYYSKNLVDEGLQYKHKEEVGKVLKKEIKWK